MAENDRHRAELEQELDAELGDIGSFHARRRRRSAMLHRGVGLRMARDRRRAQGEVC
jgi:hypothetical protein